LVIVMGQKGLGGLLDLLPGTRSMHEAPTPARACDEISPHTGGGSGRCGGITLGSTPTQSKKRTSAEGKSRPDGLPTKRGSFSKVSMVGLPCSRKNCATTSSRTSASKSDPTSRCSQIEVPASTKLAISTTCCRLPSGSGGTLVAS